VRVIPRPLADSLSKITEIFELALNDSQTAAKGVDYTCVSDVQAGCAFHRRMPFLGKPVMAAPTTATN
jgi:hypothetical protein